MGWHIEPVTKLALFCYRLPEPLADLLTLALVHLWQPGFVGQVEAVIAITSTAVQEGLLEDIACIEYVFAALGAPVTVVHTVTGLGVPNALKGNIHPPTEHPDTVQHLGCGYWWPPAFPSPDEASPLLSVLAQVFEGLLCAAGCEAAAKSFTDTHPSTGGNTRVALAADAFADFVNGFF